MSIFKKYAYPEFLHMADLGAGTGGDEGGAPPPGAGGDEGGEPPAPRDPLDSERQTSRQSIRESLESQFSEARKAPPEERDAKSGRFAPGGPKKGKEAGAAEGEAAASSVKPGADGSAAAEGATPAEGADAAAAAEEIKPPASLGKDKAALADWAKAPDSIKKALVRREDEMARGVEQLKAAHAEVDNAIAPHAEAIRRHGHTPAQAVGQLFNWFSALASNPKVAFPALAQSFGHDINSFSTRQAAAAQVAGTPPAAGAAPDATGGAPAGLPPELQAIIDAAVEQRISGAVGPVATRLQTIEQQNAQFQAMQQADSAAKTQQIITTWATGKPHFEAVRGLMAQLIQSGAVPLKNQQVDLDAAYDMAVYAHPETRGALEAEKLAKLEAERTAKATAERTAQQAQADKARAAGRASIAPGAPGSTTPAGGAAKPKKGMTVGESLRAAIKEHQV